MHRILWGIAASIVLLDILWAAAVHFDIDSRGYLFVVEVAALTGGLALFYGRIRRDDRLSGMLSGTAFLIVFTAAFSALNCMLLIVAGPRIDAQLAGFDKLLGFNWVSVMTIMAHHPILNFILRCCYSSVLPQIAIAVVVLGWANRGEDVFRFCLCVAIGACITVAFWTCFPSFGAFSVYYLPLAVSSHLSLALDRQYADELLHLLKFGPGQISPHDAKGLIGFPSFHAALAIMAAWFLARVKCFKWPAILLNAGVIVATPIQGGHHLIDIVGGVAVAALAISASGWIAVAARTRTPTFEPSFPPVVAGKATAL